MCILYDVYVLLLGLSETTCVTGKWGTRCATLMYYDECLDLLTFLMPPCFSHHYCSYVILYICISGSFYPLMSIVLLSAFVDNFQSDCTRDCTCTYMYPLHIPKHCPHQGEPDYARRSFSTAGPVLYCSLNASPEPIFVCFYRVVPCCLFYRVTRQFSL